MKTTRLLTLLASLALSTAAFAADAATAFSLKGQARVKSGDGYTLLAVGNGISEGSFIQVGAKSKLGLKTVDGGSVFFGENSSFRLRYIPDSGPGHLEITLLSGTVSGSFSSGTSGATLIRTSAGVVDTNGGSGVVNFVPSQTGGGALSVVATLGSITFTPLGATQAVTVPAGSAYTPAGGIQVATAEQLAVASAAVSGGIAANTTGAGSSVIGSAAVVTVPNLAVVSVLSPNGEGQNP